MLVLRAIYSSPKSYDNDHNCAYLGKAMLFFKLEMCCVLVCVLRPSVEEPIVVRQPERIALFPVTPEGTDAKESGLVDRRATWWANGEQIDSERSH